MCSDFLINKMMCFNDTCSENFVIFAEKYPWRSLMLQYVESQLFRTKCSTKYISKEFMKYWT